MATFGNANTPGYSWWWMGINISNQVASWFYVPVQCNITAVSVYMAGHLASVNAQCVLWDYTSGSILRNSGTFSAPSGGAYQGGQSWHTQSVTTYAANQGDQIWIGFWRDKAGRAEWSMPNDGGYFRVNGPVTATSAFTGVTNPGNPQGTIGAYCTYTATGGGGGGTGGGPPPLTSRFNLWNGTAWSQKPLNIWNGSAWVTKPLERWNGTVWN